MERYGEKDDIAHTKKRRRRRKRGRKPLDERQQII